MLTLLLAAALFYVWLHFYAKSRGLTAKELAEDVIAAILDKVRRK